METARPTTSGKVNSGDRRVVRMESPRRSAEDALSDRFFRHLVFNLRTGVLAITRDGRIAAMNDIAYRVL